MLEAAHREPRHDPERLRVPFESFEIRHGGCGGFQGRLGDVSEGWMAEIVGQAGSFDHVGIDWDGFGNEFRLFLRELFGDPSSKLRDLQGVREAVVKDETFGCAHDLRDAGETTKGGAVEDAVAI